MKTHNIPELHAKVSAFTALIEQEKIQQLAWEGKTLPFEVAAVEDRDLRVTQINVGSRRRFVVDNLSGQIYDAEGNFFGTLDTMFNFWWGDYYPKRMSTAPALPDEPEQYPVLENPEPVIPRRGGWAALMAEQTFRA